eukprot:c18321_g1_i1 orf=199-396(-)
MRLGICVDLLYWDQLGLEEFTSSLLLSFSKSQSFTAIYVIKLTRMAYLELADFYVALFILAHIIG